MKHHVQLKKVRFEDEDYFKIEHFDHMRPFFMSIVSDSNHWMFISSNGGLTAGRKNANFSLFPYYTEDKLTESKEITGSKSIFHVYKKGRTYLWEPFSDRQFEKYEVFRNLYKSSLGNKVLFEEINEELGLTFRYQWSSGDRFGFVRKAFLHNDSKDEITVGVLDGIQNIMPFGVGSDLQNQSSVLVDAYKRNELHKASGLGIYALSAIIVDKAEPSEALKANIAWSLGMKNALHLVSSRQIDQFRKSGEVREETDIKAEKGAYFLFKQQVLQPSEEKTWMIIADVNKSYAAIAETISLINDETNLMRMVKEDIDKGNTNLRQLVASADGLQRTADTLKDARHYSNVLFNIMRGGIFDDNYAIEKQDFVQYLAKANKDAQKNWSVDLRSLSAKFQLAELKELASNHKDPNLHRLCIEYLPLKFSRRHGDPSRPWNRFSINTKDELDGSKVLDYEGNWRDIFQNWEALAISYPLYVEGMIHKFLNASTFDGYNPYRITKGGIDWESIEHDDPWSYIGYWGDHQIIYLLKLLELSEKYHPGQLNTLSKNEVFVYANVPYRIKDYQDILQNPKDTIDFDFDADKSIREAMANHGADAAILTNRKGNIHHVNFIEKILATLLAKVSNLIIEGGIWMNTQRPEWNDANNALVGNGVSMVTLYYIRRFLKFFDHLFTQESIKEASVSDELAIFYRRVFDSLDKHKTLLEHPIDDRTRKRVLDELGSAGSNFRKQVYENAFSGNKSSISLDDIRTFINLCLRYMEHSIQANRRNDGLFHAYNLMTLESDDEVSVSHLSEMLEGQVAVLSSGYLSPAESLDVLDSLKKSALFREDQYSYILYPNKTLPGFLEKNIIPEGKIKSSKLLSRLIADGNIHLVEKDINHVCHFNGNFKNAFDLDRALEALLHTEYAPLVHQERHLVLDIFEEVFNHKAFTGRSGTFFGYEGLGSIYWHMVSKLLLAVYECCVHAIESGSSEEIIGRLLEHYYEIYEGIGVHKSPTLYGAFPTDPYSHTPAGKGAQQPGMTGQVKEDILSRFGELGLVVQDGSIFFEPYLLRKEEFLSDDSVFGYFDITGSKKEILLEASSLSFTICQVPVIYKIGETVGIRVYFNDGMVKTLNSNRLDRLISNEIFSRSGKILRVEVDIKSSTLK